MIIYINKEKLINSFSFSDKDDKTEKMFIDMIHCETLNELFQNHPDSYEHYMLNYHPQDYDELFENFLFERIFNEEYHEFDEEYD